MVNVLDINIQHPYSSNQTISTNPDGSPSGASTSQPLKPPSISKHTGKFPSRSQTRPPFQTETAQGSVHTRKSSSDSHVSTSQTQAQQTQSPPSKPSSWIESTRQDTLETIAEAQSWKGRITTSWETLKKDHNIPPGWIIKFDSIKQKNGKYEIQIINTNNPGQTSTVTTSDDTFFKFKQRQSEVTGHFNESFTTGPNGRLQVRPGVSFEHSYSSMNTSFIFHTVMTGENAFGQDVKYKKGLPPELAASYQMQEITNYAFLGKGAIHDVSTFGAIGKEILSPGDFNKLPSGVRKILNGIPRFSSMLSKASPFLDILNIVANGYTLAVDPDEARRAKAGVQIGSSAVSLGSWGGGAAGIISGPTAFAGGTLLVGLTVAFSALAEALGNNATKSQGVAAEFKAKIKAYNQGGYSKPDGDTVYADPNAVINDIDLSGYSGGRPGQQGHVRYGTDKLYAQQFGSYPNTQPTMDSDKSHALDIRHALGLPDKGSFSLEKVKTLFLPITPEQYKRTEYNLLPFATSRHDAGFDNLEKFEATGKWVHKYYRFPSEQIAVNIPSEYIHTDIDVHLGETSPVLAVPKIPNDRKALLDYHIHGQSGSYYLVPSEGSNFHLDTDSSSLEKKNRTSTWIIDTSMLDSEDISVRTGTEKGKHGESVDCNILTVGGATFSFNRDVDENVLIRTRDGLIHTIDFTLKNNYVSEVDGSAWEIPSQLHEKLNALNKKNELDTTHDILIHNVHTKNNKNAIITYFPSDGHFYDINSPDGKPSRVPDGDLRIKKSEALEKLDGDRKETSSLKRKIKDDLANGGTANPDDYAKYLEAQFKIDLADQYRDGKLSRPAYLLAIQLLNDPGSSSNIHVGLLALNSYTSNDTIVISDPDHNLHLVYMLGHKPPFQEFHGITDLRSSLVQADKGYTAETLSHFPYFNRVDGSIWSGAESTLDHLQRGDSRWHAEDSITVKEDLPADRSIFFALAHTRWKNDSKDISDMGRRYGDPEKPLPPLFYD